MPEDVPAIMTLVEAAVRRLAAMGVDQWQDGYPTAEIILADIARGESFVMIEDKSVVATAVISFAGEPTYTTIEGEWKNSNPYAVIHRLAVRNSARGNGYAKAIFDYAEQLCAERGVSDIRVDTHADNRIMQRLLDGLGYSYCGVITLLSGAKRIALQKRL